MKINLKDLKAGLKRDEMRTIHGGSGVYGCNGFYEAAKLRICFGRCGSIDNHDVKANCMRFCCKWGF